ncbi:MAG TPA: beta-ketoacyl-ACP synthase II [Candidatus Dormibacteraeota bacterium]|nr:beta-ketoacyl-ACP synthase II [Candidatus Dormibacteraeota bacterium]
MITGLGCLSPVGNDVASTWAAMVEGVSGIGPITQFDPAALPVKIAGEVRGFDAAERVGRKESRRMSRFSQLAVAAAAEALADSALHLDLEDRDRVGVLIASGVGGLREIEESTKILERDGHRRISPFVVPMMIADMASGNVSIRWDLRGPNFCLVSACASGAHAIGEAAEMIRRGDADVMLAGGSEAAITPLAVASFIAARALTERNDPPEAASRPFDVGRDGFVIAEGAAVLVLESEEHATRRGARVLARVAGYGASADAYHITAPDPQGRGAASAMRRALARANLAPEEVGYVNAHGTSTELNDRVEALAIRQVFGTHAETLPVSSTKSVTGHLLGAAGALESVVCVKAISTGMIPPTANLSEPDPECALAHVTGTALSRRVDAALNNSFGFGGHNASLIFTSAN